MGSLANTSRRQSLPRSPRVTVQCLHLVSVFRQNTLKMLPHMCVHKPTKAGDRFHHFPCYESVSNGLPSALRGQFSERPHLKCRHHHWCFSSMCTCDRRNTAICFSCGV